MLPSTSGNKERGIPRAITTPDSFIDIFSQIFFIITFEFLLKAVLNYLNLVFLRETLYSGIMHKCCPIFWGHFRPPSPTVVCKLVGKGYFGLETDTFLLTYKCWLIFMAMKQKFFFWKKKMQNGRLKKKVIFQLRQFSIYFFENFMDWFLGL